MARPAKVKTISAAEKKVQQTNLKEMLKAHNEGIKIISAETKAAQVALTAAKKSADALAKDAEKAAAAKRKEADTALAAAQKAYAAAMAKADKATAAAAKGTEKLNAQLEALNAMPLTETPKAGSAPKQKAVRETAEA